MIKIRLKKLTAALLAASMLMMTAAFTEEPAGASLDTVLQELSSELSLEEEAETAVSLVEAEEAEYTEADEALESRAAELMDAESPEEEENPDKDESPGDEEKSGSNGEEKESPEDETTKEDDEKDSSEDEEKKSAEDGDSEATEENEKSDEKPQSVGSSEDAKSDEGDEDSQLPEKVKTIKDAKYKLKIKTHDKYMSGDPDGRFRPEDKLTRAEFSSMLYQLIENPPEPVGGKFSDVPIESWFTKAVNSLATGNILKGDGNGKFRPGDGITRAEVVSVLAVITELEKEGETSFNDVNSNHWAYRSIMLASALEWVSGYTDGSFKPNDMIKRCEVTVILNKILERNDDDFAKDKADQEKLFFDVSSNHWAFENIMEAGKRVENPVGGGNANGTKYIELTTGVNFREGPSTDAKVISVLLSGTRLEVEDDKTHAEWIKARHTSHGSGYVHKDYTRYVEGGGNDVSGDGAVSTSSASMSQYESLYITGTIGGAGGTWTSDNTAVAEVFNRPQDRTKAFIYGKTPGTTTIRLRDGSGNIKASCAVTVGEPDAVRFAYANPNTPSAGVAFKLTAVTDDGKSDVRFVVTGPDSGTYETSNYKTETKAASSSAPVIPANTVRIFEKEVVFSKAGEYEVKAYSKTSSGSWSTAYESYNLLVVSSKDATTTSDTKRSASDNIISVIAGLEGKGPNQGEVYIDTLSSGYVPTVGYGYVVPKNGTFYNNCTETEMIAMLTDTINNGNYVKDLQKFQASFDTSMSQVQFDAMVSFGYNLGTGNFKDNSTTTFKIFLNGMVTPNLPAEAKVNTDSAVIYSGMGTGKTDKKIPSGETVKVTAVERVDGNVDNLWFKVDYKNESVWIRGGNVRFNSASVRDLDYIDEQLFGSNLLEWNGAGGSRLPGLVYRRLAEAKIFCYGNYAEAYHSHKDYRKNVGFDVPPGVPGLELE